MKLPENFRLFTFYARPLEHPGNPDILLKNAEMLERVGISGLLSPRVLANKELAENYKVLAKRGWWIGRQVGGEWDIAKFNLKRTKDNCMYFADGQVFEPKNKHDIWLLYCPLYLTEIFTQNAGKLLPYSDAPCHGLYIDKENYCFVRTLSVCFCDRCIKAFAAANKLDPAKLKRDKIESDYKKQWLAFREKQDAALMKAFFRTYTAANPKLETAFCSFFEQESNEFAAVKNSHYESFANYIMPMTYSKGTTLYDIFRFNAASTKAPFLPMIYSNANDCLHDWNSPEEIEIDLVAAAACGSKGAAFYCNPDFDGKYLLHMLRAMNRIAKGEKFYQTGRNAMNEAKVTNNAPTRVLEVDGKKIPVPQGSFEAFRWNAHRLGNSLLFTLFNFEPSTDMQIRLAVPAIPTGKYFVTDPAEGKYYFRKGAKDALWSSEEIRRGLPLQIRAMAPVQIRIEPADSVPAGISAAGPEWILSERSTGASDVVIEPRMKKNSMCISRTDLFGNKHYTVKLETPAQTVWIDPVEHSRICQWEVAGKKIVPAKGCGIVREMFDVPVVQQIPAAWEVKDRRITEDSAEVTFECAVKTGFLTGVNIQKRYVAARDKAKVDVFYRVHVQRDSKADADFQIRFQNQTDLGFASENPDDDYSITAVTGGRELKCSGKEHFAFGNPSGMFKGYLKKTLKGSLDGNSVTISSPGPMKMKITFENPSQIDQIFSWRGTNPPTAEWFYKKTDFPSDPHRAKVWETAFSIEIIK